MVLREEVKNKINESFREWWKENKVRAWDGYNKQDMEWMAEQAFQMGFIEGRVSLAEENWDEG